MRCPACKKKLRRIGGRDIASVALGVFIAQASMYMCKGRHAWLWCDPPVVVFSDGETL
jgi:uncharacterized protein with PIN domain